MKTVNAILIGSGLLLFTGCSSTFLADFARPSVEGEEPDAHWYDDPWFQVPVDYVPPAENVPSVSHDVQPLRNAGYVRRDANKAAIDDSRSTGATRNENGPGPQKTTQTPSSVSVPTRGNTGSPTGAAQKNAQGNATQDRGGRR